MLVVHEINLIWRYITRIAARWNRKARVKIRVYVNGCAELRSEDKRIQAEEREVKRYLQTANCNRLITNDRTERLKLQNIYWLVRSTAFWRGSCAAT